MVDSISVPETLHRCSMGAPRVATAGWVIAFISWLVFASVANAGDMIVPVGGSVSVGGGAINLACGDLDVAGGVQLDSGDILGVRDVIIEVGGVIDGGSGSITLSGDWSNGGTFAPGTSTVAFVDAPGCAADSTISGSTTWYHLSLVSTSGKVYTFASGSTQTILNLLTILGVAGTPIQLQSSAPPSPAFIDLVPTGTQNISHVGVSDVWATGQPLAPNQVNEGGRGNAVGWFLQSALAPAPTLGGIGLVVAILLLGGIAAFRLRPVIIEERKRST